MTSDDKEARQRRHLRKGERPDDLGLTTNNHTAFFQLLQNNFTTTMAIWDFFTGKRTTRDGTEIPPHEYATQLAKLQAEKAIQMVKLEQKSAIHRTIHTWKQVILCERIEGRVFWSTAVFGVASGLVVASMKNWNAVRLILGTTLVPCYATSFVITSLAMRNRVNYLDFILAFGLPAALSSYKAGPKPFIASVVVAATLGLFSAACLQGLLDSTGVRTVSEYHLQADNERREGSSVLSNSNYIEQLSSNKEG